jgi:hypothetical protein
VNTQPRGLSYWPEQLRTTFIFTHIIGLPARAFHPILAQTVYFVSAQVVAERIRI